MISGLTVNFNVEKTKNLIHESGLSIGSLADQIQKDYINGAVSQKISKSSLQRMLSSDGKDVSTSKVEVIADVLKVPVESLLLKLPAKRQVTCTLVKQGLDLRKMLHDADTHDIEIITEPGNENTQQSVMQLLKLMRERPAGFRDSEIEYDFKLRKVINDLHKENLGLFSCRVMQVCPFNIWADPPEHPQSSGTTWVEYQVINTPMDWNDDAGRFFDGVALCKVLILKIDSLKNDHLTFEHDIDPAELSEIEPYPFILVENIARVLSGDSLVSHNDRDELESEDFIDEKARKIFLSWQKEKGSKK